MMVLHVIPAKAGIAGLPVRPSGQRFRIKLGTTS
jgi:hypothetical protein